MLIVDNKDFVGFQVGFQRETMHCYMFMIPLHSCFCLAALKLINHPQCSVPFGSVQITSITSKSCTLVLFFSLR